MVIILSSVDRTDLTEKCNLSRDLKEMMEGAMQKTKCKHPETLRHLRYSRNSMEASD